MTDERPRLTRCPLCDSDQLRYQFTHSTTPIVRCHRCRLVLRNPQPSNTELAAIYDEQYFVLPDDVSASLKRRTAAGYLDEIEARIGPAAQSGGPRRLLELGSGAGNLLVEARARGYEVTGIDYSASSVRKANERLGAPCVFQGSIDSVTLADESFDVAVLADVIEHTRDPLADIRQVWRLLRPGGIIFIALPSLDSWSARLMRRYWMEFKLEHTFYFDRATVRLLLARGGFEEVEVSGGWKTLSAEYIVEHFRRFPVPVWTSAARALGALLPARLRQRPVRVVGSGINVIATRSALLPSTLRPHRLSVIMPVFNERSSFPLVMNGLLAKSIPNVAIDIVVIESNSTDGSRDEVRKFEGRPGVQVIYQERPRGKGDAVRAGLARATGDYVLIQDADLEYDLDDYEMLLEPLMNGTAAFVLGSRHAPNGRGGRIREFSNQVALSRVMNLGHVFFTELFNLVYGTRLRDPFTMYKVFRRDCLHGLTFECNRFDFDWELLGKLVRSGYRPIEIPIRYQSRSFAEGKKVAFFRDPPTWIRACFKYRFARLGTRPAAGAAAVRHHDEIV